MAHSYFHTKSSYEKFGGDYKAHEDLHNWFDATKAVTANFRHRALRHFDTSHMLYPSGLWSSKYPILDQAFNQHLKEDFGFVPKLNFWLDCLEEQDWMKPVIKDPTKIPGFIAKKFGGVYEDYEFLVEFFESYSRLTDYSIKGNYVSNHSWGIFDLEAIEGVTFKRSDGKDVPTRFFAEKYLIFKYGKIPTALDWLENIKEDNRMWNNAEQLSKQ